MAGRDTAGGTGSPFEERSFPSPPHPHILSQTFSDKQLIFASQPPTAESKKLEAGGEKHLRYAK